MHLVSSHANDVGLTALHLDPLPRGPARADVAETYYLVDLADSSLAAELKAAGKSVVYQVLSRLETRFSGHDMQACYTGSRVPSPLSR